MEKKLHPTCHTLSLTITAKLVAFFDMIFGLFGLVWFVIMLAKYNIISLDPFENLSGSRKEGGNFRGDVTLNTMEYINPESTAKPQTQDFAFNHKVINLSLVAFYTIVNLSVFVLLMVGIYRRSSALCLIWFHIRCAIFVFKLIIMIMYLIGGRPLAHQIPFIFSMIVHLYGLWVVNLYVDELKENRDRLQDQEITEPKEQKTTGAAADPHGNHPHSSGIYDIPNGIEILLQKRLEEIKLKQSLENN